MIFLELFITFFLVGALTIGGGYAMIPMMQEVLVAKGWVTTTDVLNFIAISESTPGVFAVNMATFTGFKTAGFFGGFIATLGLVTPSVIIITLIAIFFNKVKNNRLFNNVQKGVRPIVIGLLISIVISFIITYFFTNPETNNFAFNYMIVIIAGVCAAIKLIFKKVSPIVIIIVGAILGMIFL